MIARLHQAPRRSQRGFFTLPGGAGAAGKGSAGPGTTFRYWRLFITVNDGSSSFVSLSRLKLMEGATDRGLTYVGTPSANSEVDPAANAFDNNLGTEWVSNAYPGDNWIAVDLGAAYTLTSYQLSSQRVVTGRTPTTWILQGSNTAQTGPWTDVDSRSGQTGWGIQETRSYTL